MTSRRSQLQEDTYFRVLRMLQDNPDMTQREIAEKLGISTSGLNYCLKALIDKGWVKMQNFSQSKNKFGYSNGQFMLSRNFRLQRVGNLRWLQSNYNFSHISYSIDELVVLDVSRGEKNPDQFCAALKQLTEGCFVPIAAGGGVKTIDAARNLLRSGADKVVVNSVLYEKSNFINQLASEFGQQCVVASTLLDFQIAESLLNIIKNKL